MSARKLLALMIGGLLYTIGVTACGAEEGGELEILNIDPRAGATAGEQPVRIIGNNFRRDIGYTVYFGTRASTRSTILDDHTLLVATPSADESATVDVIVAADDGPAYRIADGYRYEDMSGNMMQNVGNSTGQGEERF